MRPMTDAEDSLLTAVDQGVGADFRADGEIHRDWRPTTDEVHGWGDDRVVRAEFLAHLLVKRRLHVQVFGARIDGDLQFSRGAQIALSAAHCVFTGNAFFAGVTFTEGASFAGATFRKFAEFARAKFLGEAGFSWASFATGARFRGAEFTEEALFAAATVTGEAVFRDAKFATGAVFREATFTKDAVFAGVTFPGKAVFANATFTEKAGFEQTTFDGLAEFQGAKLDGHCRFSSATFAKFANFTDVTFTGNAAFEDVKFSGVAEFRRATFTQDVAYTNGEFTGEAGFREATFAGNAGFRDATFVEDANFGGGSKFAGTAGFNGAKFKKDARFDEVTFAGNARFSEAEFCGYAGFVAATFVGDVDFGGSRGSDSSRLSFGQSHWKSARVVGTNISAGIVSFADAVIDEAVRFDITCRKADLTRLQARKRLHLVVDGAAVDCPSAEFGTGSRIEGSTYSGAKPSRIVSLSRAQLAGVTLSGMDLSGCRFGDADGVDRLVIDSTNNLSAWRSARGGWPARVRAHRRMIADEIAHDTPHATGSAARAERVRGAAAGSVAETYRSLRKALEDNKDEAGAADFYYGEMEMRRLAAPRFSVERWLLTAYWAVSGYGLRAWRAVVGLVAVIGMAGLLFSFECLARETTTSVIDNVNLQDGNVNYVTSDEHGLAWWQATLFAAKETVGLFRTNQTGITLVGVGNIVDLTVRILGPALIAVAVLAIRNRTKR